MVIEGVWGNNRVSGYIAVDDITVFEGDCDSKRESIVSILTNNAFLSDGRFSLSLSDSEKGVFFQ